MDISVGNDDQTLAIEKKVAIVGIGCRYPKGIENVRDFWEAVKTGRDCMSCHPENRLDPSFIYLHEKLPGKIYCREAGYLSQDITGFDRLFFQISPEEADYMDPQLRLLLEVVWESLEDYGVNVENLRQSDTGVYVGVMAKEYSTLISVPDMHINQYTASGNNSNMISNRISYQFDFRGPSITYDTACSSSMYAIHHACEAIRNGDCNLALAGGVNLFLLPSTFVALCQAGMLSPDGKCKSFDSSADGYARGEGVGIVVLKSLKEAIKDGDRIYAVIRGGALNNDGKTSGITAPSARSQMLLLKRAYEITNVSPQMVPYVETHGTGTQAGDMAEATAIVRVMARGRRKKHPPLIVGSVKSNFGHTEGAAGVAGVIKASLVLQNKQIPKLVHFQSKNESINWDDTCEIIFPTELTKWPEGFKLIAGCSSFGFGGANAHLVLEAAPTRKECSETNNYLPALLILSAASEDALNQKVSEWVRFLSNSHETDFRNIIRTAATRATHHGYRLAICSSSLQQSIKVLGEMQNSPSEVNTMLAKGRVQAMPSDQKQKLVFVFSGMGTQWWGMGRRLMEVNAVFRRTIKNADKLLKEFGAKWSLQVMLTAETDRERMNDTEIAQPSICAMQIALAEVYRHLGIQPHAVIGHSVGEVAAACVAGYITFRDAMRLIYIRGKSLKLTAGKGTMAVILKQADEVQNKLSELEFLGKVDIACVNSTSQTVISGNFDAIATIVDVFKNEGVRCVTLKVQNAFHSFQQEEIKKLFLKHTSSKIFLNRTNSSSKYLPRQVPMVSTVNGQFVTAKDLNDNKYWWQNIRQTVLFEISLRKLLQNGYSVFLEIGPHPSLASAIKSTMATFSNSSETSFHDDYAVIGSLRRPADISHIPQEENDVLLSIAKLFVQGYPLNLEMLFPNEPFNIVSLPNYPWQRQQCIAITDTAKSLYITPRVKRPLLGQTLELFCDDSDRVDKKAWKSTYNLASLPWLPHHKIERTIVLPGAAYIDMMLTVAKEIHEGSDTVILKNIQFHKFHYSPECKGTLSTTAVKLHTSSQWQVTIRTFNENNESLVQNSTCSVDVIDNFPSDEALLNVYNIQERCKLLLTHDMFYQKLDEKGIEIGKMFGSVSRAFYNIEGNECLVFAAVPEVISNELNDFVFHPCLLDAVFQLCAGFSFGREISVFGRTVEVPESAGVVCVQGNAPSQIVIHGQLIIDNLKEYVNVTIADSENHNIFAKLENVKFTAVGSEINYDGVQLWEKEWTTVEPEGPSMSHDSPFMPFQKKDGEDYIIISDDLGLTNTFAESFIKAGISPDHLELCNLSKYTDISAFPKQGEDFQNFVFLTFSCVDNFCSLNEISKDQFIRSQINEPLLIIKIITDLLYKSEPSNLSIWIITRGAVVACESDTSVNPLMSNGWSLNMTLMNEFSELLVTTLDLPIEQSINDSVQWLSKFFLQPERCENCLALRPRGGISKDGLDFQMFALRLSFRSTPDISINKISNEWCFDISREVSGNRLKPIKRMTGNSKNNESSASFENLDISVQVKAFFRQYRKSIFMKTDRTVGFLFGGNIVKRENCDGKLMNGQNIIGYSRGNIVSSVVISKHSEVVPILPHVTVYQALFVVQNYFPLYLALQETFRMHDESVVLITSDNCNANLHVRFAYQIVSSKVNKDVKVIIYVQSAQQLSNLPTDHKNVTLATEETLHTAVRDGSVDTLLIQPNFKVKSKEADTLFNKVRFHGTVAVLGDTLIESNVIKARQIGVRVVEPEYMWASENNDLTCQYIDALLKLVFSNGQVSEHINHLVEAAKVDELIDDQNIDSKICVTSRALKVPFDYDDSLHLFSSDPNSSYLVVGGTKGIGFEVARWLVSQGAMKVYISGRNKPEKHILKLLDQMKSVQYIKCDVTNETETEQMLQMLSRSLLPLTGIFHCAAVFDDQLLKNVTEEAWTKVLLPKAYGLLLLHQLTSKLEIPLQTFVAFSSITEYLGNDGQGSYCNANTFMSSVCSERRLKGLPATVIAPGAIGEVGFAAREGFDKIWANRGIRTLSPLEVINYLSWALLTNSKDLGLTGSLDQGTFIQRKIEIFNHQLKRNRLSIFKKEFPLERFPSAFTNYSNNSLATMNPSEAIVLTNNFLADFLVKRLGISEDISQELSLFSFGFDSAMSWELSRHIWSKFNVVVSSVELLNDSSNISNISSLILNRANNLDEKTNNSADRYASSSNTLWLNESREMATSRADLFCFPPTGKGISMFVGWAEIFETSGIRVIVAQLPGWEGRENEQASHDLDYLVRTLSNAILSRSTSTRVGFFGCGIGALLAFEIARYLQEEHNITINHIYICGWYPPSTPYSTAMELHGPDKTCDALDYKKPVKFLDNRDIRQINIPQKAFLNIKASETISKSYKYVLSRPLECNMTIFSAARDQILTQKILGKWKNEIDPKKEFDNVAMPTDHKLLRDRKCNSNIASHVSQSLIKEKATSPFKREGTVD